MMNSPEKKVDDDDVQSETSTEIAASWNTAQEGLLKGISEKANCMRWIHNQSQIYFDTMNFNLTIPNVVITTVNGGVTMSLTSMVTDPYSQKIALTIIGLISIFAAMLTTINQYIKSAQMSEAHRISAIAYGKLHRIVTNELSLRRDQRLNAMDFLKTIRGEQDRLENSSPIILSAIIEKFNARFMNSSIEKPEITGDLEQVIINRSPKDSMMNRVYTLVSSPFATKKNRGADVSPIKDENVITIADPNNR